MIDYTDAIVKKVSGGMVRYNLEARRYYLTDTGQFVSGNDANNIMRNVSLGRAIKMGGLISRLRD